MALCPNCNKEISENARFCSECGATLNTDSPTTDNTPVSIGSVGQNNNLLNKKLIIIAVISVVIIFAGEFATGFMGAMQNSSTKISVSQSTALKDKTSNPYIISGAVLKSYTVEKPHSLNQVTGVVLSQADYFDKGVFVQVKFYDSDGNIIDEKTDFSSALSNGDSWKFSVYAPDNADSYEITTIGMLV